MFFLSDSLNCSLFDVDLFDVPETFLYKFLYFGTRAHHEQKFLVCEQIKSGVFVSDDLYDLIDVDLKFSNFTLYLLIVDGKYNIFGYVPDGVVEVEAFDKFSMSFAQLVKYNKAVVFDVFFIGDVIVGYSDIVFLNFLPFEQAAIG